MITMDVMADGYSPNQFTLRKGVPVQWIIHAKVLNQCNKVILVPRYQLRIELIEGQQKIKITPKETGSSLGNESLDQPTTF
jgi:uncharacterized protein